MTKIQNYDVFKFSFSDHRFTIFPSKYIFLRVTNINRSITNSPAFNAKTAANHGRRLLLSDVERLQTLGHLRPINPNMINHFATQSPLLYSESYMLCVHEAIKISYSYHLRCQRPRNCQKDVSHFWLFVNIHGSVDFPILSIDIEKLSRWSKHRPTLSIISIS